MHERARPRLNGRDARAVERGRSEGDAKRKDAREGAFWLLEGGEEGGEEIADWHAAAPWVRGAGVHVAEGAQNLLLGGGRGLRDGLVRSWWGKEEVGGHWSGGDQGAQAARWRQARKKEGGDTMAAGPQERGRGAHKIALV